MNNPEGLIDTTLFGVVADYLHNPKTPIDLILHSIDRPTLVELATRLGEVSNSGSGSDGKIEEVVKEFISAGRVKISSREPIGPITTGPILNASEVPRDVSCEVIYMPPFYLVHTPGLFLNGSVHRKMVKTALLKDLNAVASRRF